jgi:hypothetical protein
MTDRELLQQALDALEKHVYEYETIQAIRTRLAQPEPKPEPVSWGVQEGVNLHDVFLFQDEAGEMCHLKGTHAKAVPLYTAPPKKEWVGLTKEERKDIFDLCEPEDRGYVAAMVEAKLKEKNGG